jgi:hypothetical protein
MHALENKCPSRNAYAKRVPLIGNIPPSQLPSNQKPRTPQRKSQHQRCQDPRPSLIPRGNRIRQHMALLLPTPRISIRTRIRIPYTLTARIPRIRRLQIPNPEHIRSHSAQRTHLLSHAVRAVPLRLCPLHAAGVSGFTAAALARGRDAAGFDVWPDCLGEFGDELRGDGEPAEGVAFEGEAVCVAVSFWFAGAFDGDVVYGEEFGEGVVEEAFEGREPFGVFGLLGEGVVSIDCMGGGRGGRSGSYLRGCRCMPVRQCRSRSCKTTAGCLASCNCC